jgi:hypothetical protein
MMDLREKSTSNNIQFILLKVDSLAKNKLVSPFEFDNGNLLIIVKQMDILHEVREIFLQFLTPITAMEFDIVLDKKGKYEISSLAVSINSRKKEKTSFRFYFNGILYIHSR